MMIFALGALISLSHAASWKSTAREGVDQFKKGNFESAGQSFDQAVRLNPENPLLHFNKGCAAYKLGDWEGALNSFNQSKQTQSKDTALGAKSWYNLGNTFYNQGKTQEAIEAYKKSLLLNPKDDEARHNLAVALRQTNPQKNQQNSSGSGQEQDRSQENKKEPKNQEPKSQMGRQEMEALLDSFEQEQLKHAQKMKKRRQQEATTEFDW